ncbi:unnamed protein product, partial [Allacma fusca]
DDERQQKGVRENGCTRRSVGSIEFTIGTAIGLCFTGFHSIDFHFTFPHYTLILANRPRSDALKPISVRTGSMFSLPSQTDR